MRHELNPNSRPVNWEPVHQSERYPALDLLRGFALFGVLMVNLLDFFRASLFDHILHFHSHAGWANHAVDLLVSWLLEFKAFALFSLTFGIGVAIQAERARLRGVRLEVFLLRRFLILLAFGTCHMLLVSNVDILMLYSVCGLLLIPVLRLPADLLTIAGLVCLFLSPLSIPGTSFPPELVLRQHVEAATRIYSQAGFGEILVFRWQETKDLILPLLLGVALRTLGLMFLGVAVWRFGVVQNPGPHRRLLWAICLLSGVVGVITSSSVLLAFAYAAALLAWQPTRLSPVACLGRMALTNYLAQSLIFALVFYGYGFGLFGRLAPAPAALLGVTVYAAQITFSVWWLNRYRFGPFEWLWRSLTYGHRQPL